VIPKGATPSYTVNVVIGPESAIVPTKHNASPYPTIFLNTFLNIYIASVVLFVYIISVSFDKEPIVSGN